METHKEATIVGAGMAGCMMAIFLARAGWRIEIYESQDDLTKQPTISGRSINQSLSAKGIAALEDAQLWETVKAIALPQQGRIIHQKSGKRVYEPYGQTTDYTEWTVNRNELNKTLLAELKQYPEVTITFGSCVTAYDVKNRLLTLEDATTGKRTRRTAAVVIGADGINSKVRQALDRTAGTRSVIEKLPWGYKNILVRVPAGEPLPLQNDVFHCWPRTKSGIVGMANRGFFTCTLILPLQGQDSFASLNTKAALLTYFDTHYSDLSPYIDAFAEDFIASKPTVFRTLRSPQWFYKDRTVLIGDAAHAMTIFMGQGINAAFDDCAALAKLLTRYPADFEAAFSQFQAGRKIHTDVMADISLQRFVELKDKYSSQLFLARTRVEMLLERLLPKLWLSQYTLIVHTRLPYALGQKRYNRQRTVARLLGLDAVILACGMYLLGAKRLRSIRKRQPNRRVNVLAEEDSLL